MSAAASRVTPRVSLATLPTPLEEAPRLSQELGIRLLVKRDDLTGLALGGNKARKLELLVADAIARGHDTLVATGGAQSNFARMTAAAAARHGLRCHLVLGGPEPALPTGNLLLDHLFGARLHFAGSEDWRVLGRRVQEVADELGERAYPMPLGGSTPLGCSAYVGAARELLAQMESRPGVPDAPDWVVVADGTGGTHAGLLVGLPASVQLLGVDVSRPPVPLASIVENLAAQTADLLGVAAPAGRVLIEEGQVGESYAAITTACRDAVRLAARLEGWILDPVYTGKAFAGLLAGVRERRIQGTVVFWHTGGAPALFAGEYAHF